MNKKDEHNMEMSRRDFLKLSAGASLVSVALELFPKEVLSTGWPSDQKIFDYIEGQEINSICNYCGVGCGMIAKVLEDKLVEVHGDPLHPINEGSLCPKGSSMYQMRNLDDSQINPQRLTKVLYRAPNDDKWQEKTWEWALTEITKRIKETRDSNWVEKDTSGNTLNHTEAIASIGTVFLNHEECYTLSKAMRALGIVYIENEARICASTAVSALTESFGRGPSTNHWIDLGNSDCIMIIGANPAETFPIVFKWILRAKEEGAKIIHVDPRYTRTSAKADIYARLRIGTDIAFVGGIINYIIQNNLFHEEYVKEYTTALFLIDPDYGFTDGLFSGWDESQKSYDKSTWGYQLDGQDIPKMAENLEDPNCVFQILKNHFSRYDVDTVCEITGTPKDIYLKICQTFAATGQSGKAGAIVLSSGIDQHATGTQMVLSLAILQLLLGNIGVAGGGLNGMAGAVNGLGCTLNGRLFHVLPGFLATPMTKDGNLAEYLERTIPPESKVPSTISPWRNNSKYFVSLMKAWYDEVATKENDFCFEYLPKISTNHSWIYLFDAMYNEGIKGLICWSMNPVVSAPNSNFTLEALEKLDWMVIVDLLFDNPIFGKFFSFGFIDP